MDKFTVVIAEGPNDIRVPCLIFNTVAEARTYLENTGLKAGRYERRDSGYMFVEDENSSNYPVTEDWIDENSEKFFVDYYDGCGGVYSFTIEEVSPGEKFVGFDLD